MPGTVRFEFKGAREFRAPAKQPRHSSRVHLHFPAAFFCRFTLSSRRTCLSARRAAVDPTRKSETVALSLRH
jgi:hypothetical protein